MSRGTSEAFFEVIEWCADQAWSSGKLASSGSATTLEVSGGSLPGGQRDSPQWCPGRECRTTTEIIVDMGGSYQTTSSSFGRIDRLWQISTAGREMKQLSRFKTS